MVPLEKRYTSEKLIYLFSINGTTNEYTDRLERQLWATGLHVGSVYACRSLPRAGINLGGPIALPASFRPLKAGPVWPAAHGGTQGSRPCGVWARAERWAPWPPQARMVGGAREAAPEGLRVLHFRTARVLSGAADLVGPGDAGVVDGLRFVPRQLQTGRNPDEQPSLRFFDLAINAGPGKE